LSNAQKGGNPPEALESVYQFITFKRSLDSKRAKIAATSARATTTAPSDARSVTFKRLNCLSIKDTTALISVSGARQPGRNCVTHEPAQSRRKSGIDIESREPFDDLHALFELIGEV
jgi:hypothetical protein